MMVTNASESCDVRDPWVRVSCVCPSPRTEPSLLAAPDFNIDISLYPSPGLTADNILFSVCLQNWLVCSAFMLLTQ